MSKLYTSNQWPKSKENAHNNLLAVIKYVPHTARLLSNRSNTPKSLATVFK